jgi:hypothetical protein
VDPIFDVNQPETRWALGHWWSKFCACRPLGDEELSCRSRKKRQASHMAQRALQSQKGLRWTFIDELVPLLGSPSSSLATPEEKDERYWIPTQGPDCVSSGSDDEVVAHNNGSLESSPVDLTVQLPVQQHSKLDTYKLHNVPTLPRARFSTSDGYEPCHSAHPGPSMYPVSTRLYGVPSSSVVLNCG